MGVQYVKFLVPDNGPLYFLSFAVKISRNINLNITEL